MIIYEFLKNKGILEKLVNNELIDVGSGDGSHGKEFEAHGFKVSYIEKENGLDAITYDFPKNTYGIAVARNSLPFMGKDQYKVISKIYSSLKRRGYFYGTVFGKEEPWAKKRIITPIDFKKLRKHFKRLGFEILWEGEEKGIGRALNGEIKLWHIFKFLCKK
ncbi:MAG TPA: hypothetical protein VJH63_04270 [Candidatus Paceibacterota bacterium]